LVNPTDKISPLKKDKERYYRLILRYFVFLDRELARKAEVKLSEETNEQWERRRAFLMGKRFNVVPMWKVKSHFVTIDYGVLYGIMREICPEFDVSREEFSGEHRETYWKSSVGSAARAARAARPPDPTRLGGLRAGEAASGPGE
jgi:hypothetical protein